MTDAALSPTALRRIAVLGSGHVGPVIARLALDAGFEVAIASSGSPEKIALITQVVMPGAEPRWAAEAVQDADLVVLAIPLHRFATFEPTLVAGKVVIDAMNYWPSADGVRAMFEDRRYSSSEIVQRRLDRSTVVKTLNHIGYQDLEDARRPAGSPERLAIGVAGDDAGAVDLVEQFIDRLGYQPVRLDSLSAGRLLEPGGPVFGAVLGRPEFELAVRAGRQRAVASASART
jgi:8-hydroxy-5-deazaflavin:NADPH oxidoreductase